MVDEWYVFVWNGNKCEAQRGYNDDLTMAFSIGLFVRDYALKLRNDGLEINRNTLKLFHKTGTSQYKSFTPNNQSNPWSMDVNGQREGLDWLL